jgi:peroxiredoxin
MIILGISAQTIASPEQIKELRAPLLSDGRIYEQKLKNTVVVFLSARCPCSRSHEVWLSKLAKDFKSFKFLGIHSNADESLTLAQEHFRKAKLSFDILEDKGAQLADQFKAFKTPHAYVYNEDGNLVYQGGVSDSHEVERSKRKFLLEVLEDLKNKKAVRISKGRTLGCVISRKN